MTFDDFTRAVREYRRTFQGSITSWGRTPARNRAVGGAPASLHLTDMAVDIVCESGADPDHRVAHGFTLGLAVVIEPDHDHLQPLE